MVDTKLLVVAKVPSALEMGPPIDFGTKHKKNKSKAMQHFVLAHYPPRKHSVHLFFFI